MPTNRGQPRSATTTVCSRLTLLRRSNHTTHDHIKTCIGLHHNSPEESTLSREEVVAFISHLNGTSTVRGYVANSPGNFYVDVIAGKTTVARLVFFDSRIDHAVNNTMINNDQLAWFEALTDSLPRAPTLAFYHIPLNQYKLAIAAKVGSKQSLRPSLTHTP